MVSNFLFSQFVLCRSWWVKPTDCIKSQHELRTYFRDVVKDPNYKKTVFDMIKKDLVNVKSWYRRQRKNANYHWKKKNRQSTAGTDDTDKDTMRKELLSVNSALIIDDVKPLIIEKKYKKKKTKNGKKTIVNVSAENQQNNQKEEANKIIDVDQQETEVVDGQVIAIIDRDSESFNRYNEKVKEDVKPLIIGKKKKKKKKKNKKKTVVIVVEENQQNYHKNDATTFFDVDKQDNGSIDNTFNDIIDRSVMDEFDQLFVLSAGKDNWENDPQENLQFQSSTNSIFSE
jgi:hypothetical protein